MLRVKPAFGENINNRSLKFNILRGGLFILNFYIFNNENYILLKLNLLTLFKFFIFLNFVVIANGLVGVAIQN